MALIKCPECGKEISDKADKCPNCGVEIIPEKGKKKDSALSIASAAIALVSMFAFNYIGVIGIILGLVDIGRKDKRHRHLGSYFGIVMGIIAVIVYIIHLRNLASSISAY